MTPPSDDGRERCRGCGALFEGLVCEYCGLASRRAEDPARERDALDELHVLLRRCEPDMQDKLLREGFLPATAPSLLEAAALSLPYLKSGSATEPAAGAAARLDAIVARLSVLARTDEIARAIETYQAQLAEYRRAERTSAREGMFFVGAFALAVIAGLVWAVYRLFS